MPLSGGLVMPPSVGIPLWRLVACVLDAVTAFETATHTLFSAGVKLALPRRSFSYFPIFGSHHHTYKPHRFPMPLNLKRVQS